MSTYAKHSQSQTCDECGAEMVLLLFCDSCGADYPDRRHLSAFSLLGLEPSFSLAEADLEHIELEMARRLHPDRWHHRGERLHKKALLAQSAANEALEAIRGPFARGDSLLDLQDEVAAGRLGNNEPLPADFLMEQIELQEEAANGPDPTRKREMRGQVRSELTALQNQLGHLFAHIEGDTTGQERLEALRKARGCLDRARYWRNLQRALKGPVSA